MLCNLPMAVYGPDTRTAELYDDSYRGIVQRALEGRETYDT